MQSELISFGPVHLDVRKVERSVPFWRDLVGLELIEDGDGVAVLGVGDSPLVVLHRSAVRPVERGYSGLFHVAIHLPSEPELARVLARLNSSGHRFGASDHIVAKSLYINDPDGIGVEIAFETPERVRSFQWTEGTDGPLVIDSDGRRRHGIEPLDVEGLLTRLRDSDIRRSMPQGSKIGHLQFHVGDLETSYRFYRDKIGLSPSMFAPWAGYGDLGAGGRVAHRIALNTWSGAGHPPRPADMAGLRSFTIRFRSPELLSDALARIGNIEARESEYLARDPNGNVIRMAAANGTGL